MNPPPAATHAASPRDISVRLGPELSGALARALQPRAWSRLRLLVDLVTLYLASSAALFAAPITNDATNRWVAACFPLLTLSILHARRSPDDQLNGSLFDTFTQVLGVVSLATMLTIAADSILGGTHAIALALRLWLFALVYLGLARLVLLSIRNQAVRNAALGTPTLVVGAGVVGAQLVKRLVEEPRYGLRPVGFLDADPLPSVGGSGLSSVPVLGTPLDLAHAVARTGASRVILAFSSEPDRDLVDTVKECQQLGVSVSLIPRLYEAVDERATLDHVGGLPLLTLQSTNPRGWQFAVKHAFDRGFALVALIACAPLMILIALAVRLSSPGPVFFRQCRVGRDGHVFDLLKFRTMYERRAWDEWQPPDGCAPGGVEGVDNRTAIGRFLRESSLDELPQLINVLFGDMSLIGPRPERPEFVERFADEVDRYQDRHRVKSGITGWAQVNGLRGQTSINDRVEFDNYYIRNWSLRLDGRIMALTIAEVLRFRS
jgi:exopolysaccharide biosynthesis polyprenyl glycosylphosphotransferase